VNELYNLTTGTVLNIGDTQAAVSIITKLTTNNAIQPKNTQETKDLGQVSTGAILCNIRNDVTPVTSMTHKSQSRTQSFLFLFSLQYQNTQHAII